jgi:hypothetical protein
MYLRFTTQFTNPYGEMQTGIFMALKYLREDYLLTNNEDVKKLKELTVWFSENLKKPDRLSTGTSKHNANVSLSWFKDTANDHLKKMQDFIKIAEHYDIVIERIISKNPGYVVYEDEYQVSAVPFRNNRNKVI